MGIHYSYECTKAKLVSKVEGDFGNKKLYLFDLEFDNEHGQALRPVSSVLVAVEDDGAELVQYPENVLEETASEEDFDRLAKLVDNYPGYEVYNVEDFSAMVLRAIGN